MAAKIIDILDALLGLSGITATFVKVLQRPFEPIAEHEFPLIAAVLESDGFDSDDDAAGTSTERVAMVQIGVADRVGNGENVNDRVAAMIETFEDAWDADPGLGGKIKQRDWGDWRAFHEPAREGEGMIVGALCRIELPYRITEGAY